MSENASVAGSRPASRHAAAAGPGAPPPRPGPRARRCTRSRSAPRAPVADTVEVDLHEGLETTLVVLAHKLKHTAIKVERDFDRGLPKATVRGSELNQVWTNLHENAIDALDGSGTITLTTRRDGDCARIEVVDDGPGIPPEVRDHVFDPFFTTKDVGAGTGLGLDTARRIVADRHAGSLAVESAPGRTVFRVTLPLR